MLCSTGYFVRYIYPDKSVENLEAECTGDNTLHIKKPPGMRMLAIGEGYDSTKKL